MTAPAIFANNDVKYDANKTRARSFAAQHRSLITYAVAKDTPSEETLREKPGIAADKVKWLQRHDRESGDLYGMLPLIHRMPVALTDHIDRNPDVQLLRGKSASSTHGSFTAMKAARQRTVFASSKSCPSSTLSSTQATSGSYQA